MVLPRPPVSFNTPIPNQPFASEEVYYLEGNQGHLPLGAGLYIDPTTGEFTNIEPSPYIYCTPQFSNLPVTYPPYNCNDEVNTSGVTDFTNAWYYCDGITDLPCFDTSSGENFTHSWSYCYSMVSFPRLNTSKGLIFYGTWYCCYYLQNFPDINTSSGTDFNSAWDFCEDLVTFPHLDVSSGVDFSYTWGNCSSLTSFPILNVSSGENFIYAWQGCSSLTSFPLLNVSSGTDFERAWNNCTSLTSFPAAMFDNCSATGFFNAWYNCALNQTSVDNILVSLDAAGQSNGNVGIWGGTSAAPGAAGLAAKASLEGKGWTVLTN